MLTAHITLPKPITTRRAYIGQNVETVATSATHRASTTMPVSSSRVTPKRLIAKPPNSSSGALSQNAETRAPVACRVQWNSTVSGSTSNVKQYRPPP